MSPDDRFLFQGRWLSIKEIHYTDKTGAQRTWEIVERKNQRPVVVIVARLMPSERYILIKQFRPAIRNYVLGFPAGIIDSGDPVKQAHIELREETGYSGRIASVSPELKSSPATMNIPGYLVEMEVDETDPVNQNPRQALEPAEDIEVILLKKEEMREYAEKARAQGMDIGAAVWYFLI